MSLRKPPVPYTDYKEPSDTSAQIGLPSSIISGNTADGGLRSITYKAIYAALLIEELDMARRAVILGVPQVTQISESNFASVDKMAQLREETAALKGQENTGIMNETTNDEVCLLNRQLDLGAAKGLRVETKRKLRAFEKEARGFNLKYVITKVAVAKARKMEDVPGFDADMYLRAAERRRDEQQQKIQSEKFLAEQQKQSEADVQESQQPETELNTVGTDHPLIPEPVQNQEQEQEQEQEQGQSQIPVLGLDAEPVLHLPEHSLDDISYAMDSDVLMVPGFTDNYIQPLHGGEHLASIPPLDASYLQGPEPQ